MKTTLVLFLFLLSAATSFCQNRNSVWCFGDSAGIDFSSISNPQPIVSVMDGRGSCVSISNDAGQLINYAYTRASTQNLSTVTRNSNGQQLQSGDSIVGEAWYNELSIIPKPANNNLFYLFSIGIGYPQTQGFYYSIIDINQNGGIGAVTQKNIQLNNFRNGDCVSAVKHANGRDWWLFSKYSSNTSFNRFYVYLITPDSIYPPIIQNLGGARDVDFQKIIFKAQGDTFMLINRSGYMGEYLFDRCSGTITLLREIFPQLPNGNGRYFWFGAYSPSGTIFYVSTYAPISFLIQFDLTATNIPFSGDTLDTFQSPIGPGALHLAPDNKIYFSCAYECDAFPYCYPYPDSVRNYVNENLSVINYPDSAGAACNYQPFSFYLGGKRTYYGLPNNPNYSLGPLAGSSCDSLTTNLSPVIPTTDGALFVFYHTAWHTAFINAKGIKGKNYKLRVHDMLGNIVFKEEGTALAGGYFTKDLNCIAFSKGMYLVTFETEKEKLVKKFVVN